MRLNMKKMIIILVLLLAAAGIITASFLVNPVKLSSAEITEIKANCADCHKVPKIQNREEIHQAHTFLQCGQCHTGAQNSEEVERNTINNSVCVACHTKTDYTSAVQMHDAHSTTGCATCHTESSGLAAANNTHKVLRPTGIGLAVVVVLGLLFNYVIASIRVKRKTK
jgi:hypothetical protein